MFVIYLWMPHSAEGDKYHSMNERANERNVTGNRTIRITSFECLCVCRIKSVKNSIANNNSEQLPRCHTKARKSAAWGLRCLINHSKSDKTNRRTCSMQSMQSRCNDSQLFIIYAHAIASSRMQMQIYRLKSTHCGFGKQYVRNVIDDIDKGKRIWIGFVSHNRMNVRTAHSTSRTEENEIYLWTWLITFKFQTRIGVLREDRKYENRANRPSVKSIIIQSPIASRRRNSRCQLIRCEEANVNKKCSKWFRFFFIVARTAMNRPVGHVS